MSAYFITGTGTDIGKTWLCCALLRHWRGLGLSPGAIKPVLSGFAAAVPETSDAGQLLLALGRSLDQAELDEIAPWRFAAPLSPDMAAALEGRILEFDQLIAFSRRAMGSGPMLIEGVGGVMVPLDAEHSVRDWMAALELPAVLVAGSYLGSLSHTLTAVVALQQAGIRVAAIVVNESVGSTVGLAATVEALSRFAGGVPMVAIERARAAAGVAQLASLLEVGAN